MLPVAWSSMQPMTPSWRAARVLGGCGTGAGARAQGWINIKVDMRVAHAGWRGERLRMLAELPGASQARRERLAPTPEPLVVDSSSCADAMHGEF